MRYLLYKILGKNSSSGSVNLPPDQQKLIRSAIENGMSALNDEMVKLAYTGRLINAAETFVGTSLEENEFLQKLAYITTALDMVRKAVEIAIKKEDLEANQDLKRMMRRTAFSATSSANRSEHFSIVIDSLRYTKIVCPLLIEDIFENGMEGFLERLPEKYYEILANVINTPTSRKAAVSIIRRDVTAFLGTKGQKSSAWKSPGLSSSKKDKTRPIASPAHNTLPDKAASLKAEIENLYRSIRQELGSLEVDIANIPVQIENFRSQLAVEKNSADTEKSLHLSAKRQLEMRLRTFLTRNADLTENNLATEIREALTQKTRILKPLSTFPERNNSARLEAELRRLKISMQQSDWFDECEEGLDLIKVKEKLHSDLSKRRAEFEADISHQQKRYERYGARRKYIGELSLRLNELSSKIHPGQVNSAETETFPPLSLFRQWYDANPEIHEHVFISDAAIKATEMSAYSRPDLIYRSVGLLAREFHRQKTSGNLDEVDRKASRAKFKHELRHLGLSIGGSITTGREKLQDVYSATVNGERIFLDQHLQKGNSRDARYCMRIYFAWSEKQNAVIIGHMPTHLRNQIT